MNILYEDCFTMIKEMHLPTDHAKRLYYYVQWFGRFSCKSDFCIKRSDMKSILLIFTESGSGVIEYCGKKRLLSENTLAIIDCEKYHTYRTECEPWNFKFIHFYGNMSLDYYRFITETYQNFVTNVSEGIRRNIDKIIDASLDNSNEAVVSDLIYRLLTELIYEKAEVNSAFDIEKIKQYIYENYMRNIDSLTVASYFGYSRCYFSTRFKDECGDTLYSYLNGIRLSAAKEMLKNTDLSVSQIAGKSGFGSCQSFIRAFKNSEKTTPLSYRKRFENF